MCGHPKCTVGMWAGPTKALGRMYDQKKRNRMWNRHHSRKYVRLHIYLYPFPLLHQVLLPLSPTSSCNLLVPPTAIATNPNLTKILYNFRDYFYGNGDLTDSAASL